jgi:6,7-dimethyl-8-ribityllumazine synthase
MSQKIIEGSFEGKGLTFAIVVSRFNNFITDRLLDGALDALNRHSVHLDDLEIVKIPGAWEMPLVAAELARQKRHDAIICLGAVIRGDTPHFDYVAGNAASGLANVAAETGTPIAFGVLTTNTLEQAIDRAGAKSGNKGFDAAMTAIEMANLLKQIRPSSGKK